MEVKTPKTQKQKLHKKQRHKSTSRQQRVYANDQYHTTH